ncbi:MAG: hypothetical protein KatS3mg110_1283 [Pirellulaceae bacterium]|nr:MAG: hypothetical protein KatS3mg110_1283 [Pirellulaceae bacterium]
MARAYAGILGLGAFVASVARGVLHGVAPAAVLWSASLALLAAAVAGLLLGTVAAAIVRHAVLDRLQQEVARRETSATPA